jgi:hypothetical protein
MPGVVVITRIVITVSVAPETSTNMSLVEWDRLEQWIVAHFWARFGLRVTEVSGDVDD